MNVLSSGAGMGMMGTIIWIAVLIVFIFVFMYGFIQLTSFGYLKIGIDLISSAISLDTFVSFRYFNSFSSVISIPISFSLSDISERDSALISITLVI